MKRSAAEIKKLIEKIEWKIIPSGRCSNKKLNDDEVAVGFMMSTKKVNKPDRIVIRLGQNIRKNLKWEIGEKIDLFYDDKNVKNLLLSPASSGRILAEESSLTVCRLQVKKPDELSFQLMHPTVADHYIHNKNQLIIFIP